MKKLQFEVSPAPEDKPHVQGCGDPSCAMCMPDDPSKRAGDALVGDPSGGYTAYPSRFIVDELRSMDNVVSRELARFANEWAKVAFYNGGYQEAPRARPVDEEARGTRRKAEKRAELEAREKGLRNVVKSHLLQAAHTTAWNDVVGNETARQALIDAIETPIVHAELFRHYGKKPTKGVLLWGQPGNGKTMLAKAAAAAVARLFRSAAGESVFALINGPSIQSPYVGVTEKIIRDLFAYARVRAELDGHPMVIFIDEADAILPPRAGAHSWEESNVATFLAEMDGLEANGALVILATNRPHHIDAALLRDGRCDRKIKVERPDQAAATEILRRCLLKAPIVTGLTAADLAGIAATEMFSPERTIAQARDDKNNIHLLRLADLVSGAMMTGLAERAKENAFRRDLAAGGKPSGISIADIVAAVDTVHDENAGLDHTYALQELGERVGAAALMLEPMRAPALSREEIRAARH